MMIPFLAFDLIAILQAALPFAAILILVVIIHEIGHFVAAKMFGIKVLEFGIGFPPRIKGLTYRRGETEYTINWLPIGGFVRLLGEEDPSDPRSLAAAPAWKRLVVLGAGVMMNVALAIMLFSFSFMLPRERSLSLAQIVEVAPGSPAAEAQVRGEMRDGSPVEQGLLPGDIVYEVEGEEVRNVNELIRATRLNLGETQDWVIVRANSTLSAEVYARFHPPADQGPTGVRIGPPTTCVQFAEDGTCEVADLLYTDTETVWSWPWEAVPQGVGALVDVLTLTKNELQVRIGGGGGATTADTPAVTGPVGIAETTGDIIDQQGWRSLIEFTALMSLNLAFFNILPIPALDGGRMFFVVVEILRGGRRISPEKEAYVHFAGFALMIGLAVVITYFDIARIVTG